MLLSRSFGLLRACRSSVSYVPPRATLQPDSISKKIKVVLLSCGVAADPLPLCRPEYLVNLVIPDDKKPDPSDDPEHIDCHSPTTLLEN
eukprot:767412-Hanusia_phi.AAC.5